MNVSNPPRRHRVAYIWIEEQVLEGSSSRVKSEKGPPMLSVSCVSCVKPFGIFTAPLNFCVAMMVSSSSWS